MYQATRRERSGTEELIVAKKAEGADACDITLEGDVIELAHEVSIVLLSIYERMAADVGREHARAVMATVYSSMVNEGAYNDDVKNVEEVVEDMRDTMVWALTNSVDINDDEPDEDDGDGDDIDYGLYENGRDNIRIVSDGRRYTS